MQATTPQQLPTLPTLPAPPVAPGPGPVLVGTPQIDGQVIVRPATAREVAALQGRGRELSRQLNSANDRRNDLARKLTSSDPGARAGLEQRIQQLDQRILGIERDIAENGRQLAMARPELTTEQGSRFPIGGSPRGFVGVGGSFVLFIVLGIAAVRAMTRRRPVEATIARSPELDGRLDRLEQGVEAIALEVERIAEGQRFVTKLMTESQEPLALNAGQAPAEAIPLRQREEAPRSRAY